MHPRIARRRIQVAKSRVSPELQVDHACEMLDSGIMGSCIWQWLMEYAEDEHTAALVENSEPGGVDDDELLTRITELAGPETSRDYDCGVVLVYDACSGVCEDIAKGHLAPAPTYTALVQKVLERVRRERPIYPRSPDSIAAGNGRGVEPAAPAVPASEKEPQPWD
jgi:hypothetical protein